MPFINDDFLLTTKAAKELYHGYAEKMPIIDYHCHLPPAEIAADQRWENIAQVWLGGDHYKWRQMRSNGIDEKFITGDASWHDKFLAFAETMEVLLKNPLFDWSHLELARYFGVNDRLSRATAEKIWKKCNAVLAKPGFSAQGLMKKSNVKVVCTTDDPVDSLEHHLAIAKKPFGTKILPAWRSDKASKVENVKAWNEWMDRLAKAAKMPVKTWDDFLEAMAKRHAFFAKAGCVISDYGVTEIFAAPYTEAEVRRVFKKARGGKALTPEEALKLKSAWLYEGLAADAKAGWAAHGGGREGRLGGAAPLLLSARHEHEDVQAPRPRHRLRLHRRMERGGLARAPLRPLGAGRRAPAHDPLHSQPMQLGAAWWFLDQKDGMRKQLEALGALGCLGNFVGMLTDSRSFLSYTRHEYFRRILCQMLGKEIAAGELPNDIKWIGGLVSDICYNNANRYFFGA